MSIVSEILALRINLQNAYTAISSKGGTLPASQNFDNLASAISTVPSGSEDIIDPNQVKNFRTVENGVLGYSSSNFTYTFPDGVTEIMPAAFEEAFINCQTLVGIDFNDIETIQLHSCRKICEQCLNLASASFPNLVSISSNALENFNYYEPDLVISPMAGSGQNSSSSPALTSISFPKLESILNSGLKSAFSNNENLTSISFPSLTTIQAYSFDSTFSGCSGLTSVSLSGITESKNNSLYSTFYNCTSLVSLDLSNLVTANASNSCKQLVYGCSSLTILNLDKLEELGSNAFQYGCYRCTSLTSMSFPKLRVLDNSAMQYAFYGCTSLTTLSFPALTSQSFGSYTNQFNSMLGGVTGCTVHFPSNLSSVIGSWSSVTNGFGGTNTTVLFDLPATS